MRGLINNQAVCDFHLVHSTHFLFATLSYRNNVEAQISYDCKPMQSEDSERQWELCRPVFACQLAKIDILLIAVIGLFQKTGIL